MTEHRSHAGGMARSGRPTIEWANHVWNPLTSDSELLSPLRWRKQRRARVKNDLFHPDVPDEWRDRAFAVMALAQQHTFLVLTKRPNMMRAYAARFNNGDWIGNLLDLMDEIQCNTARNGRYICHGSSAFTGWPLPNVWLGVSTEDQAQADARIPPLLATPAAKRFISAEPLLGPIDLSSIDLPGGSHEVFPLGQEFLGRPHVDDYGNPMTRLDWVICGGESGPNARPMHPDWARSLRDQCALAGVPFFFKQWGAWAPLEKASPVEPGAPGMVAWPDGQVGLGLQRTPGSGTGQAMFRTTAKLAGNMLDGRQHLDLPQ